MRYPAHISARARKLWRQVTATWDIEDAAAEELLRMLVEAVDRRDQARALIDAEGLTITDARGAVRAHPAVAIEQASRAAAARLMTVHLGSVSHACGGCSSGG
jgi:P27 family predicted phage terminase small subunit